MGRGVKEGVPEEVTFKANTKDEQELELATRRGKGFREQGPAVGNSWEPGRSSQFSYS